MNDFEKRLIKELADAQDTIKAVRCQCKCSEQDRKQYMSESGLYSAMLADIAGLIFGCNSEGAPQLISYPHAGWSCGPVTKKEDETVVEVFFRLGKKLPNELGETVLNEKKIEEWRRFLALLSKMKASFDAVRFMKKVKDE